jgi:hypothetical protein
VFANGELGSGGLTHSTRLPDPWCQSGIQFKELWRSQVVGSPEGEGRRVGEAGVGRLQEEGFQAGSRPFPSEHGPPVGSTLPARSMARTSKVYNPLQRLAPAGVGA